MKYSASLRLTESKDFALDFSNLTNLAEYSHIYRSRQSQT